MADYDDFDAPPHDAEEEHEQPKEKGGIRKNIAAAWQASPVFKIFLLLVGGGAIASAALGVFSADKPKDVPSRVNGGSNISATPGGEAPPAFQEAVTQASQQRAQSAQQQGGSAMPTPMGDTTQMTNLEPGQQASDDPLAEFRAPQQQPPKPEGVPQQQQPQQQQAQPQQQPARPPVPAEPPLDQGLASAMQQQMQQIVKGWDPAAARIISVTKVADTAGGTGQGGAGQGGQGQQQAFDRGKTLVPAGTINYAQMAIEANSDVPGPIMAQVLSGPFSGGKAIGRFESTEDYLIIRFSNINFKGKDYPVSVLALNPDTTLGAVASETDKRYLSRVIVPAAAQFVSGFSRAFTQDNYNTFVQDGIVISQRTNAGVREGLAQGGQEAGDRVSQIINNEASKIKPLVRVAVGTPIGLFFTSSVFENTPDPTASGVAGVNGQYANGPYGAGQYGAGQYGAGQYGAGQYGAGQYGNPYGTQPYGATSGYGNPYAATGTTAGNAGGYNPYAGSTAYGQAGPYSGQSGYPSNAYGTGINVIPAGGTTPVIINR